MEEFIMKRIIVCNWISLDGFFSGPNDETDWFYWNDEVEDYQLHAQKRFDTMLFGRRTYDIMANYWPTPLSTNEHPAITRFMNNTKKIVFSKSLKQPAWNNCTLLPEINKKGIENIKEASIGDILILGSGSIASQLINLDMVDELRLFLNPVILGKGNPMFQHVHGRVSLRHEISKTFSNGLTLDIYTK